MRLTAEFLQRTAEQRTNPLHERELVLRGWGIVALEHLAAASASASSATSGSALDALDVTSNRLTSLSNLPGSWAPRWSSLTAAHNRLSHVDIANLRRLTRLVNVDIGFNALTTYAHVWQWAQACPQCQVLVLRGNVVTAQPHYRRVVIALFAKAREELLGDSKDAAKDNNNNDNGNGGLKVLDYQRIGPVERQQARTWSKSAEATSLWKELLSSSSANTTTTTATTNTLGFEPGQEEEEDTLHNNNNIAPPQLDADEKQVLQQLLQDATSEAELQDIQRAVLQMGVSPHDYLQNKQQQQQQQQPGGNSNDNNKDSNNKDNKRSLAQEEQDAGTNAAAKRPRGDKDKEEKQDNGDTAN